MTGYLYQVRYALLRGLEEVRVHPGHELSIEKFDDVAFEEDGSPIELIQTKHHVNPGNVSDASVDFWKTMGIWIDRTKRDPNDVATTRLLFLTTNTATRGSALAMLRRADSYRDEPRAIDLLGAAATRSTNQETETARKNFLELTQAEKRALVRNVWVFDKAPNIINVREEIESILHFSAPPGQVANLTDHLEGWWFRRVIAALGNPDLTVIRLSSLRERIAELQDGFRRSSLPLDEEIDTMPVPSELPRDKRTFVQQMNLVRVSDAEVMAAVHDYYRAYAQRSKWARENLVSGGDADAYDRRLCDEWHRRFLRWTSGVVGEADGGLQVDAGRKVFHWAREFQLAWREREEIWLSSGSFQMLADEVKVGWHPNYESLIASLKEEA